jgi:FMN phosphatase YigB (HAD superfamily)
MIELPDNRTCFFDVDDTLLEWSLCAETDTHAVEIL